MITAYIKLSHASLQKKDVIAVGSALQVSGTNGMCYELQEDFHAHPLDQHQLTHTVPKTTFMSRPFEASTVYKV